MTDDRDERCLDAHPVGARHLLRFALLRRRRRGDAVPSHRAGPRARAQPQPDRLEALARRRPRRRGGRALRHGHRAGRLVRRAAALLLDDRRLAIGGVVSVDIDPRCAEVARSLNATRDERALRRAHRGHARDRVLRPLAQPAPTPTWW
ncbi:MAG: hypothetical protein MZW92_32340 [Comamonadaceae bacterium]|nr:hypothetical protein [Comamonadaceae bacterium]